MKEVSLIWVSPPAQFKMLPYILNMQFKKNKTKINTTDKNKMS